MSERNVTNKQADKVIRAMTNDGAFRVITALTTETVRGAIASQNAKGTVAGRFGELVTGALLIREAMSPNLRVQGILKGASGKGSIVADAHPDGTNRGLVGFSGTTGEDMAGGKGALLKMMRTLPNGSLHQGIVEVSFEAQDGGISGALMSYMQHSEQIVSTIAVATLLEGDEVVAAGGYIVELLPEVERGPLMIMTQRLEDFPKLDDLLRKGDLTPNALIEDLLYGMPYTLLAESDLRYACHCSELRVLSSLATLPRSDIEDLLRDNKPLEITCDYCRKEYGIQPSQLQALLMAS
ncbi:Hsp33 family molecular chaperone HslO [Polyangium fumosum]|uniref:Hsp33 family molecular chaperone HslO n=1 Tax=Polyangium fumosum TaxID=889272 RepID=A0A4U1J2Y1_9BACT|nr:Hsp33 family molecular chaperone HslO [Polyangium fumosum]TKD01391.1 Hsp33 family molecular chaperone HslO [Polyangium fumosum]